MSLVCTKNDSKTDSVRIYYLCLLFVINRNFNSDLLKIEWINWEPCGQACGPGMPKCPNDEKCQMTEHHDGSPLLCHGRCEKVSSF